MSDEKAPSASFWKRNWIGVLCGVALIVVALVAALLTLPGIARNSDDSSDPSDGDRVTAFTVCQDEMRSRLKVPEAAVFAPIEDAQIKHDGGTWVILSEVDAADGAGGTVHSTYRCTAMHVSGSTYQVKTTLLG